MMDKNEFWELIQTSYREADWETDKEMENLIDRLADYSQEEILKFGKIYDIYAKESNKKKLWAAAYVMSNGCSDYCFENFRGWLISRGKEPYFNALMDPDSLADLDMPYEDDYYENNEMSSVGQAAFNKKIGTDEDINVYFERQKQFELDSSEVFDIVDEISLDEDIDANWAEHDEERLEALVPRLYNKYW